jgi:hypothetical protein
MFTKHVSQLNYSDIDDLVNVRQEREGYHLDYKGEFGNLDKAKKELTKDITAFANTGGGYLVIGVDKHYNIAGIDKTIQNKEIDEWVNQILSSNSDPQIFYFDPKVISIPDSEKVIVVIHVPESTKKPHIVTEWNNYYIRINDSSKSANHNQIRDMFEFSKNRTDEFNEFLKKKKIADEDSPDFGINKNSSKLFSEIPTNTSLPKPIVLFSLIPKYPNEEKINLPVNDFKNWLERNSKGYEPYPSMSLFYVNYDHDLKLDGIVLKQSRNREMISYFEILNNGYAEAGLSSSITYQYEDRGKKQRIAISLTQIIGYEMFMLGFARKLYELAKCHDEVLLQLSFVNVLNYKLYGLNRKFNNNPRSEWSDISNKQHNNFKLNFRFNPKTITDEEILLIAKQHSEKICRVFGLDQDYCFVDDKLTVSELDNFYL